MEQPTIYKATCRDLTDAGLLDLLVRLGETLDPTGEPHLQVTRFETMEIFDGVATKSQVDSDVFGANKTAGELRTISKATLNVSLAKDDRYRVEMVRTQDKTEVSFMSERLKSAELNLASKAKTMKAAEKTMRDAQTAWTSARNSPQDRTQHQKKAAAEQAQTAHATAKQQSAEADLRRNEAVAEIAGPVVRLISAAHDIGLLAPKPDQSPGSSVLGTDPLREQVAALRDIVNKQARNNEDLRVNLERRYEERVQQLEAHYLAREEEANEARRVLSEELKQRIENREKAADELSKTLATREASLDLMNERETRRKLRAKLQEAASHRSENPDLSKEARKSFAKVTSACRWTIAATALTLLIAVLVPPTLELVLELEISSKTFLLLWSIRLLSGVTLAAALIYYVRALSAWSQQVSSIELRSKQFALDVDRASWLVEMNLEYEKDGKALPDKLLESFSHGLFENEVRAQRPDQPSGSMLELIRNAESLSVKGAGAEIAISGRQLRRADAEAAKSAKQPAEVP